MQGRLEGKVILVAGAGGIGNELARHYAGEGASVLLGDINVAAAKAVAEEIAGAGRRAIGIELDGADDDSIRSAVDLAVSTFGTLHGLHANFGSFSDGETAQDVLEMPLANYDEVMRVNARGFLLCTRRVLPVMLARGGGSIVYTSSAAAHIGEEVRVGYAMSKVALHALMRHVARRFGPAGIRANVIAPGVISHPRFEAVISPEIIDAFKKLTALKTRLGSPTDIAAMGALLLSDNGGYITGQVISVDGGNSMRP
jgi:NAD(P)-dependent dehydrogenase (short-subunit alcohol dehydrogenase family)